MTEMTWAQLDKLAAEREAKRRDVVERLARVLGKEFSLAELKLLWSLESRDANLIAAFEQARIRTKK